jgi:hypothetical protein
MSIFIRVLFILICTHVQGCIWVSDPHSWPEDFVQLDSLPELIGKREADVVKKLGQPTYVVLDESHIAFLYETIEADWAYSPLHLPIDAMAIFYGGLTGYRKGNEISCVLLEFDDNSILMRYQTKTSSTADALQMRYFWTRRYDCLYLFDIGQDNFASGKTYSYLKGNLVALEQYRAYLARVPGDATRLQYLCSAADKGHPNAQIEVGRHFAQGIYGIQKDFSRAYVWYSLASKSGYDTHLKLLIRDMKSEQINDADRMLAGWEPGQCERDLIPAVSGN